MKLVGLYHKTFQNQSVEKKTAAFLKLGVTTHHMNFQLLTFPPMRTWASNCLSFSAFISPPYKKATSQSHQQQLSRMHESLTLHNVRSSGNHVTECPKNLSEHNSQVYKIQSQVSSPPHGHHQKILTKFKMPAC